MPLSLGAFIRERRQDLGLTQEDLADRIGGSMRQAEVSRLESNRIALPRRERMVAIAKALKVSLGELLVRSGWMTDGDRLAAAVQQVQTLEAKDALSPQSVAELAAIVADVQAMVADATQTVDQAARALAHAQKTLGHAQQSVIGASPTPRGPAPARRQYLQTRARAGTGRERRAVRPGGRGTALLPGA